MQSLTSQRPLQVKSPTAVSCKQADGSKGKFESTIASACELGIGIDNFIAMTRLARASDPKAAQFLDAWDGLSDCEQRSGRTADTVCEQIGLAPLELLKVVAEAAYRFSMYAVRLAAAVALPSVVERSIEVALTDKGISDRKMLFQHTGFLPMRPGAQTNIAISQNAQLSAVAPTVSAPQPEATIRRLSERLNDLRVRTTAGERDDGR